MRAPRGGARGGQQRRRLRAVVADDAPERAPARRLPAGGLAGAGVGREARIAGARRDLEDPCPVEHGDGRGGRVRAGRPDQRDHLRVRDGVAQRQRGQLRSIAAARRSLVDRDEVDLELPDGAARLVQRELLRVDHVPRRPDARLGQLRVDRQCGACDAAPAVDVDGRAAARERRGAGEPGDRREQAPHGVLSPR